MKNTGKSTLIRKLIEGSHHDPSINPFANVTYCSTNEIQQITKTLFINGKFYNCTFIDTPGLTTHKNVFHNDNDIRQKLFSIGELNLIIFVFKHGETSTRAMSLFSGLFKDMTCLSAAVITFCDKLNNDDVIREFASDPFTKQFSADIGGRVYPVGFPNTANMQENAAELYRISIQKNISKLHELIELFRECIPAEDVIRESDHRCSIM